MRKLLAVMAAVFAAACGSSSSSGSAAAPPQTAAPTFSPPAGTFDAAQSVTITSATSGAAIYFTTDGVDPTTASSVYSTPVPVSATTTLKAIATAPGFTQSTVASATYTIGTTSPPPPPPPAACTLANAVPTCSSCHGNPPPAPHQQTVTTCAVCHGPVNNGTGTPSTGMTAVASGTNCVLQYPLSGTTHNNGTVNFGAAQ